MTGVDYAGLVFYPRSPRFVKADRARAVADALPPTVAKVGLFVDSGNDVISHILEHVRLDWLQLHGEESVDRVQSIRRQFGIKIIKAIRVADALDLAVARDYADCADMLLFDSRTNRDLPGGTGISFDWKILSGKHWPCPWMLSGGLNIGNVSRAVQVSGAQAVDASSGLEDQPGRKSVHRIHAFLKAVRSL